jgi:SAM-dependent methyltransferase
MKVTTRTDATGSKHIVQLAGDGYPDEGARGLDFPYRQPVAVPFTQSKAYQRGLQGIMSLPMLDTTWQDAQDNGFADLASMDAAHEPIVRLATAVLDGHHGDVLDLGCGNGALLEKIARACPRITPVGVELDPERVARARTLHSGVGSNILAQDMFDVESVWESGRRYRLALLMPGRLIEADFVRASRLMERLRRHCDRVLVYAYGDWLTRYGDIGTLARTAGLNVESDHPGATVALLAW